MDYRAPLKDIQFTLEHVAGLSAVADLPGFEEATPETASAILEECARFCESVVAPLNRVGDTQPARAADGMVTTSPGWQDAYAQFAAGGWQGVIHPAEFGGAGLPKTLGTPCSEMVNTACLSFALAPLLSDGAIEALLTAGSPEQQALYVPRLLSGEWTGTMNLTESQAGSDLSQVRTRAVPQPDGSYRIFGQKIFISYGEHDLAGNIVHLVLARTPDAPEGVKGISLFIVPKYLVDEQGETGARNDVYCVSIEHKLGIHGSPTCVLQYGDDKGEVGPGAIGHLVGEENRGLQYMFVMMNAARYAVGVQGLAVAERAYQHALAFARDRVQSRDIAGSAAAVTIIHHPDVRRLLMSMRSQVEAARSLAYYAAAQCDYAHRAPEPAQREAARAQYEFLVPLVKGWITEMTNDVASAGVQVHGGMGYVEETGAAQYYRDARILAIYEGTTAIQANDLVGRKTGRDGGRVAQQMIAGVRETASTLETSGNADLCAIARRLSSGADAMQAVVEYVLAQSASDPRGVHAGSVPYLKLAGMVLAGWQLARAAQAAAERIGAAGADQAFLRGKIASARFFAEHFVVQAAGMRDAIIEGSASVLALDEAEF
ncbi:MAG: acyl-CoA dehydrogenase [Burkholderiaceae bacterium]